MDAVPHRDDMLKSFLLAAVCGLAAISTADAAITSTDSGLRLVKKRLSRADAVQYCRRHGQLLSAITISNIVAASELLGDNAEGAWIASWNGDTFNHACLMLSGTAVVVPPDCAVKKQFFCGGRAKPWPKPDSSDSSDSNDHRPHRRCTTITSINTQELTSFVTTTSTFTSVDITTTTVTTSTATQTCCAPLVCPLNPFINLKANNGLFFAVNYGNSTSAQNLCSTINMKPATIYQDPVSPFYNYNVMTLICDFCIGKGVEYWTGPVQYSTPFPMQKSQIRVITL